MAPPVSSAASVDSETTSASSECDSIPDRSLLVSGFSFQGESEKYLKVISSGVALGNTSGIVGSYQRFPVTNDWHIGEVLQEGKCYFWENNAGLIWPLYPDLENCRLGTDEQNPYFNEAPYFYLFSLSGDQSCVKENATYSNNITTSNEFSILSPGVHLLGLTRSSGDGVSYGTAVITDGQDLEIGETMIRYSYMHSSDGAGVGHFHGYGDVVFANLTPKEHTVCDTPYVGYSGVDISYSGLKLDQLEFGEIGEGPVPRDRNDWPGKEKPLMFGTLFSDCYTGVLVFEKGGVFGAIDPYYMDDNGDLVVRWWYLSLIHI